MGSCVVKSFAVIALEAKILSLQHKWEVVMNLIQFLALEVKFCRFCINGRLSWI